MQANSRATDHPLLRQNRRVLLGEVGERFFEREQWVTAVPWFANQAEAYRLALVEEPDREVELSGSLSMALDNLGRSQRNSGDLQAAATTFAEALDLDHRRARRQPDDQVVLRDLAISLGRAADIAARLGHDSEAAGLEAERSQVQSRLPD